MKATPLIPGKEYLIEGVKVPASTPFQACRRYLRALLVRQAIIKRAYSA